MISSIDYFSSNPSYLNIQQRVFSANHKPEAVTHVLTEGGN